MVKLIITVFVILCFQCTSTEKNNDLNQMTVGSGIIGEPARGPQPAYAYDRGINHYVMVKNWDFGENGTIQNIEDLNEHFQYHDQFGTIANGQNYGALIVSPDQENALEGQPVEQVNTNRPVREFFEESMKTYVVPLDGAEISHPTTQKAGCGSFQAKWTLPYGGSLLGKDLIWETRVRYNPPPYFWFAIWTAGNEWSHGAEMDLVESFGYDNGGGCVNFNGQFWHSSVVGGSMEADYHKNWSEAMKKFGFENYDASEYHIWTWVYRADNTYSCYLDGCIVQKGTLHWTVGGEEGGQSIDMSFIFDAGWGHAKVKTVNCPLAASAFEGSFYEWDYSRIYLRNSAQ